MLQFFKRCSQGRGAWLLMAIATLLLELAALYFQHVMLLQPCVVCIYERCALFGILAAAQRRFRPEIAAALCGDPAVDLQRLAGGTDGVEAYHDPTASVTV